MHEGWKLRTIESLCSRVTSGATPNRARSEYYSTRAEGYPWVKTKELNDGFVRDVEEYISEQGLRKSSAKLLPKGTILMAMYGATVGKLGILASEMTCNQASCAMVVDPKESNTRFLYYRLLNDRDELTSLASGSAQQNLSGTTIKAFEVLVPPLHEQEAIADVLSSFDDLIDTNSRLSTELDAIAGLLLDTIPELVDLGAFAQPVKVKSARPTGVVDHYSLPAFDEGMVPEEVNADQIKSNKLLLDRPVTLVSRLNPRIPRNWMVYPRYNDAVSSTEFVVLEGKDCATEIVYAATQTQQFTSGMNERASGTTGSHQRVEKSGVVQIRVPDARKLDTARSQSIIQAVQAANYLRLENLELGKTRDALMPLLLSGKITPNSAAKLLEDVTK